MTITTINIDISQSARILLGIALAHKVYIKNREYITSRIIKNIDAMLSSVSSKF